MASALDSVVSPFATALLAADPIERGLPDLATGITALFGLALAIWVFSIDKALDKRRRLRAGINDVDVESRSWWLVIRVVVISIGVYVVALGAVAVWTLSRRGGVEAVLQATLVAIPSFIGLLVLGLILSLGRRPDRGPGWARDRAEPRSSAARAGDSAPGVSALHARGGGSGGFRGAGAGSGRCLSLYGARSRSMPCLRWLSRSRARRHRTS